MKIKLPSDFLQHMHELLGEEFPAFLASYEEERTHGMRLNPLKLTKEEWQDLYPAAASMQSVPWSPESYYYGAETRLGKLPLYHAGLFYIQEPSAMAPVQLLDVQPGQRVLDLCAAPGGKSTQIAGKLQGQGVLVSNDIVRERTKALAKNIELAGVRNAVVLNEDPARMETVFANWFDRILIDAPCSGEGMFRKDTDMPAQWAKAAPDAYTDLQYRIICSAAKMLAPGGRLVYSTCTFSPLENELQIARFLVEHEDFEVVSVPLDYGWQEGRGDLALKAFLVQKDASLLDTATGTIEEAIRRLGESELHRRLMSVKGTVRIYPHHVRGEGHYLAVLKRKEPAQAVIGIIEEMQQPEAKEAVKLSAARRGQPPAIHVRERKHAKRSRESAVDADPAIWWRDFQQGHLSPTAECRGKLVAFGTHVYVQPDGMPSLDGLQVVRGGWYVGESKKGRFQPSQALAMGLRPNEAQRKLVWDGDNPNVLRYLRGETVFANEEELERLSEKGAQGYVLICLNNFPLGWGKMIGNMIRNELSAGWRLM